jgi:predicted nucleic acid-binding protein
LALAWALPDEASRYTDEMLTRVAAGKAWVPPLWPYEMANGLAMAERRRRLSATQRSVFIDELLKLPIEVELRPARMVLETLISLAAAHGLTAYDAAYLDLSVRKGLTLMTQDKALMAAAAKLGVPIAS